MTKKVTDATYSQKFGRTICEVHREIYDILYEDLTSDRREDVLDKLEEAYGMAKKMNTKLRQYKFNYDDDWWEKERASEIEEKLRTREARESK